MDELKLLGKIKLRGKIHLETGLSIGGSAVGIGIGGVDNPVIKDVEGKPYIPGSSLKGKLRSLLEKSEGKPLTQKLGGARIHICQSESDFDKCPVCKIFGLPGEKDFSEPTRLIVRDSFLTPESEDELRNMQLDTDFTEVKYENVIDRITSAANPRQMERVPAGACFNFEMIYNVFSEADKDRFRDVLKTCELLENDYLGSSGTRGYGKIHFDGVKIIWNTITDYEKGLVEKNKPINQTHQTMGSILEKYDEIRKKLD